MLHRNVVIKKFTVYFRNCLRWISVPAVRKKKHLKLRNSTELSKTKFCSINFIANQKFIWLLSFNTSKLDVVLSSVIVVRCWDFTLKLIEDWRLPDGMCNHLFQVLRMIFCLTQNKTNIANPCNELQIQKRGLKISLTFPKERNPKLHVKPRSTEIATAFCRRLRSWLVLLLFVVSARPEHESFQQIRAKMVKLNTTSAPIMPRTAA